MAGDSSFDIVSKIDHQEVDNALNQTAKEISQRFDFKNTGAAISWHGDVLDQRDGERRRTRSGRGRRVQGEADQATASR